MKQGDTILVEKPYAFVLKSILKKDRCDFCFTESQLKKCSRCSYVSYCGRNCQRSAWSLHKLECYHLKKILPRVLPDSAHLLIRLILRAKEPVHNLSVNDGKKHRTFQDLMSHVSEICKDDRRMEHLTSLAGVMLSFFGEDRMPDDKLIVEIFGKMCTNSFNILDDDMNSIGTGLYLDASRLDHSCKPNAVVVFDKTTLYLRAIEDLPEANWDTLRICYIDALNTPSDRKQELQSMYYFLCDCPRCCDIMEEEAMNSIICPNNNCAGFIPILKSKEVARCISCDEAVNKAEIEKYLEVVKFCDHHIQNMKNKDMAYLDVCKNILDKQKDLFHDWNVRKIKILDLAFEASISLQRWNDALKYGRELHPGFRKYYGDWHPLLGLLLMNITKIILLNDDCSESQVFYRQAQKIILVTHGPLHPLYNTLQSFFM